jgi:glucoamylase
MLRATVLLTLTAALLTATPALAAGPAPGGPGDKAVWTEADKDGFATSRSVASRVWLTLDDGRLTEVFYPDLGTPAVRDLQFVVSDGATFTEREQDSTRQRVKLLDPRSLSYLQVNTDRERRYRIIKAYTTDPARNTVVMRVRFESLTKQPLKLYVLYDPSLSNQGDDDSGSNSEAGLVAVDGKAASALVPNRPFARRSSGFLGTSDGWTDLRSDHTMDWDYETAANGNVVQTGLTALDGRTERDLTLALGFGADADAATVAARDSLGRGFTKLDAGFRRGWHRYLKRLRPAISAVPFFKTYFASAMVLAASEDKQNRGAVIASPSMPWAWGLLTLDDPSAAYHLVWPRDAYQVATAMIAMGDRAAANRMLDFTFRRQQQADGSFTQNTTVGGAVKWDNIQMDEVALPIVLAWQLGRFEPGLYSAHIKRAADYIATHGPFTRQERWENQSGYSPGTIAAEIAGLVCAADIARRNGDASSAAGWEALADDWQSKVEAWTATDSGPYDPKPYYLRLTKDGDPNRGTTYSIGDGGPSAMDQRAVVDPSFLELVRLGVKSPRLPVVLNTLRVVDSKLRVRTPNGRFWHRFNFDGYGEEPDGGPWDVSPPDSRQTMGRIWPIFAGERGEYQLLAARGRRERREALRGARNRLRAMARSGNSGFMMPEQVWDENPPSGQPGFKRGEGTFSATPLAWSHAQFIRLAHSIDAGRPVELPRIVARRYQGSNP